MSILTRISKVTAAASSHDLTTLTTVKAELDISGPSKDGQLRRYITAASAAAAQFCNRQFVVETIEDDFWPARDPLPRAIPGGLEPLQLSRYPLINVASVVENDIALVAGSDFTIDAANGQLVRLGQNSGYPCRWPALAIVVAYSAGFATIPADLEDAVIRMIRSRWFAKDRDPMAREINIPGVLEQQFWVATGTDAGNMTPDVIDILENYRVPVIA